MRSTMADHGVSPAEAPELDPRGVSQLDEAAWIARVYRRGVRQLTVRAVITGLVLGFLLSFANVYIGLKTGWFFSMALVSCLVSFTVWRLLASVGLVASPLSVLETNCMQTTASSAACATGNMVVGVFPAMLLLSIPKAGPAGAQPHWGAIAAWIACVSALGVMLAIPIKRQLINRERLPFPSGTASAITLHSLYQRAPGMRARTRALLAAIAAGAALPVLRDIRGLGWIGQSSKLFDWLPRISAGGARYLASDAGLVLDHSLLLAGAGVFVGVRTSAWMLIGGVITGFVLGPIGLESTWIDPLGHSVAGASRLGTAWFELGIWLGAPLLVSYALVTLAGNWRAFVRTFAARRAPADPASAGIEIPLAWFWWGFALFGSTLVALGRTLFDIPVLLGVLAVATSLVFAMVAARITGETEINPGGAMGKLTQLGFGILHPQDPQTNLMTAAMTHGSSVACADLLSDLKSGYLLGASPRRQLGAQLFGIAAGTVASVLAYFILIPDATALTGGGATPQFAAPAAHLFQAMAELLQFGLDHLHPLHRMLVLAGAAGGLVIASAERLAPPPLARWLPSAAGLGLGLLLPMSTSLAMLIGAALAALATRWRSDAAERYVWPISAGLLGGESLAGVLVAIINNLI